MESTLPPFELLTQETLMNYLKHFLDIFDFRTIDNGRKLLLYVKDNPQHSKVKTIIRKVMGLFNTNVPAAKVCSLQFLKEAMEVDSWVVVEAVERIMLPKVTEIIEYRSNIRSIQRGTSYFISKIDKDLSDEDFLNLTKLSSTFFRMVHECVYIWGLHYFPGSQFDKLRIKLERRFQFPDNIEQFRFFNQKKISAFKENCKSIQRKMVEYRQEMASQSSIEKKRQSSIKPSRVGSGIQPHKKSHSSDQLKKMESPGRMTKQLQRQYNETLKREEEEKKKKFSHKPKAKRSEVQQQKQSLMDKTQDKRCYEEQKKSISDNNSNKINKKNSFHQVNFQQEESSPQLKLKQRKQEHFKTIYEDEQSEFKKNSLNSSDLQPSSELSEVNYNHHEGLKLSLKSQSMIPGNDGIKMKKYTSQQIVNEPSRINSQGGVYERQHLNNKQSNKLKQKEKVPPLHMEQLRKNKFQEEMFRNDTSRSKVKNEDNINSRRSTARKKFVSSEEEQSQKQIEEQPKKQIQKSRPVPKIFIPQNKQPKVRESGQQKKMDQMQGEPAKEIKLIDNSKRPYVQPVKMSKPKKVKGNSASHSVYEGTKQYSIISHQAVNLVQNNHSNKVQKLNEQKMSSTKRDMKQQKIQEMGSSVQIQEVILQSKPVNKPQRVNKDRVEQTKEIVKQEQMKVDRLPIKKPLEFNNVEQLPQIQQIQNQVSSLKKNRDIDRQETNIMPSDQTGPSLASPVQHSNTYRTLNYQNTYETPRNHTPISHRTDHLRTNSFLQLSHNQTIHSHRKSRFQKYSQVNLSISPSEANYSQVDSRLRLASTEELKSHLQEQMREEFDNLKTALFQKQENSITQNIQQLKSILNQPKSKEDIGVECSIPSKYKNKVKYIRKKQFMEELPQVEPKEQVQAKNQSIAVQTIDKKGAKGDGKLKSMPNGESRKGSVKGKRAEKGVSGEYQPNTLLYALYRKKSMNL